MCYIINSAREQARAVLGKLLLIADSELAREEAKGSLSPFQPSL